MKSFFKILFSIIIIFILISGAGLFYLSRGLEDGRELKINNVKLSQVNDGIYSGEYNSGRWSNSVEVTIKNHKITKINVVKDVTFSKKDVTEELITKIIKNQNTNVDVVSGSTVTCKAYLKAIENALKK
ncbi:FMN-binding domain protein [Clostridium homopropionicum DSM 5847]|uniref:FMN-binding domain protein n=1 Tax=Clostridium homopropionicum DSM 5847 TaxID=1121318 RepID=A0A0L6ZBT5_9CLOT|nr:FMN-binding protein [Clostridium homopropionicum]KOA20431.1 FMN-binding domain protein [Clostridium homopropionicum DSM 5847]SFG34684.1 FMN-binding domain-containing protein [Clostridium homopropionicum]